MIYNEKSTCSAESAGAIKQIRKHTIILENRNSPTYLMFFSFPLNWTSINLLLSRSISLPVWVYILITLLFIALLIAASFMGKRIAKRSYEVNSDYFELQKSTNFTAFHTDCNYKELLELQEAWVKYYDRLYFKKNKYDKALLYDLLMSIALLLIISWRII